MTGSADTGKTASRADLVDTLRMAACHRTYSLFPACERGDWIRTGRGRTVEPFVTSMDPGAG